MKIFVAGLETETNSFAPFPTIDSDFEIAVNATEKDLNSSGPQRWLAQCQMLAKEDGFELVQSLFAAALPAGKTLTSTYRNLKQQILKDLKAALPVNLALLKLHGAMMSYDCDDCEGDLLQDIRKLVGSEAIISVALDPHTHLTTKMSSNADILVCYKEWPHIDIAETLDCAYKTGVAAIQGEVSPCITVIDLQTLAFFYTLTEPMKSIIAEFRKLENDPDILNISLVHGFHLADMPDIGAKLVITSNNQPEKGLLIAQQLAEKLLAVRGKTGPDLDSIDTVIEKLLGCSEFPVIIADTGDIPGGGAAGDGTQLLSALLECGISDIAYLYLWDPMAVAATINLDVGTRLQLRIGGKATRFSGQPLDVEATIVGQFPNHFVKGSNGLFDMTSDVVIIQVKGVQIAISSERLIAYQSEHLTALGMEPARKKAIIVKSAGNHCSGYLEVAASFLYASSPGTTSQDLDPLNYKKLTRKLWPLVNN